jgi:hypothetical protein
LKERFHKYFQSNAKRPTGINQLGPYTNKLVGLILIRMRITPIAAYPYQYSTYVAFTLNKDSVYLPVNPPKFEVAKWKIVWYTAASIPYF